MRDAGLPNDRNFDVAIIGGGPAGIAGAAWCDDLGLSCILIEYNERLGGQLLITHSPITNYLGIRAENGPALAGRFADSISDLSTNIRINSTVDEIIGHHSLRLSSGEIISFHYLVIATGLRRRKLGIEAEGRLIGKGILSSGAGEKHSVRGKKLVIVGGGDSAVENAVMLADTAASITLVHRRDQFTARSEFTDRLPKLKNVDLRLRCEVIDLIGKDHLQGIVIKDVSGDTESIVETDLLLVRIGYEPNTEIVKTIVELDRDDHIIADKHGRSSVNSIFAIGDVAAPLSPTIQSAAGSAAVAIKNISHELIQQRSR